MFSVSDEKGVIVIHLTKRFFIENILEAMKIGEKCEPELLQQDIECCLDFLNSKKGEEAFLTHNWKNDVLNIGMDNHRSYPFHCKDCGLIVSFFGPKHQVKGMVLKFDIYIGTNLNIKDIKVPYNIPTCKTERMKKALK